MPHLKFSFFLLLAKGFYTILALYLYGGLTLNRRWTAMRKPFCFLFALLVFSFVQSQVSFSDSYRPGTLDFAFDAGSDPGQNTSYTLNIYAPGVVRVMALWRGPAPALTLLVRGPGARTYQARMDGTSPLILNFYVSPRQLSNGTTWQITILNLTGLGGGYGRVYIQFPIPTPPPAPPVRFDYAHYYYYYGFWYEIPFMHVHTDWCGHYRGGPGWERPRPGRSGPGDGSGRRGGPSGPGDGRRGGPSTPPGSGMRPTSPPSGGRSTRPPLGGFRPDDHIDPDVLRTAVPITTRPPRPPLGGFRPDDHIDPERLRTAIPITTRPPRPGPTFNPGDIDPERLRTAIPITTRPPRPGPTFNPGDIDPERLRTAIPVTTRPPRPGPTFNPGDIDPERLRTAIPVTTRPPRPPLGGLRPDDRINPDALRTAIPITTRPPRPAFTLSPGPITIIPLTTRPPIPGGTFPMLTTRPPTPLGTFPPVITTRPPIRTLGPITGVPIWTVPPDTFSPPITFPTEILTEGPIFTPPPSEVRPKEFPVWHGDEERVPPYIPQPEERFPQKGYEDRERYPKPEYQPPVIQPSFPEEKRNFPKWEQPSYEKQAPFIPQGEQFPQKSYEDPGQYSKPEYQTPIQPSYKEEKYQAPPMQEAPRMDQPKYDAPAPVYEKPSYEQPAYQGKESYPQDNQYSGGKNDNFVGPPQADMKQEKY